jgi:hypothetical protein
MRANTTLFVCLYTLALAACDGGEAAESGDTADAAGRSAAAASSDATPRSDDGGFVDAVTVRVSGGTEASIALRDEALSLGGGCDGNSPISLGFFRGTPTDPDWFRLGFDTAERVGTGETGTFDLDEVRWDDGTFVHQVGGREVRVPDRFAGSGTLTLTTHDATMAHAMAGARRLTGTLRADSLTNRDGVAVRLEADFDVHLSCGVKG